MAGRGYHLVITKGLSEKEEHEFVDYQSARESMYLYQRSTDDFMNAFVVEVRTGKVLDATFPLGLIN